MAIVSVHYLFTSIYEASTEKIVPVGWTFRNPRWALDLNSDTFILGILVCFFRHLWTGDPISHHQTIQVGWIWFGKMQDTATSTLWPSIHFYSETHPKPLQFCVQIWDAGKKNSAWCWESTCPWPDGFRSAMKVGTSLHHWKRTKGHRAKDLPDSTTPREALMWELGSLPFGCYSIQSHLFFTSLFETKRRPNKKCRSLQLRAYPQISNTFMCSNLSLKPTLGYPGVYTPKWTRDCSPKQQMPCLEVGWIPPKMAM